MVDMIRGREEVSNNGTEIRFNLSGSCLFGNILFSDGSTDVGAKKLNEERIVGFKTKVEIIVLVFTEES